MTASLISFVLFFVVALVGAWHWGSVSDPKRGGTVGCCRCGQCLSAGECVYRKKLLENSTKNEKT